MALNLLKKEDNRFDADVALQEPGAIALDNLKQELGLG